MKSNFQVYDYSDSAGRIKDILDANDESFEESDSIPSRDRLTFTNGFYAKCTAIFIDLRNSSTLPDKYRRPTLARIYRSFISECVAVINNNPDCQEINIHGDAVWGVFNTPLKSDIDDAFATAYTLNTLVKLLNKKYVKYKIDPIAVGIGMSWGRALMIKAGYKGSAINEVLWMGDVVNDASNLCNKAGRTFVPAIAVSSDVYLNLNDHNKSLLTYNYGGFYQGDVVHKSMNDWVAANG